jgi:hypothetical protein
MIDSLVYQPDQPTSHLPSQSVCDRFPRLVAARPRPSPRAGQSPHALSRRMPDRVDRPRAPPTDPARPRPTQLSHFTVYSVILLKLHPFFAFAQPFLIAILLNYFSCYSAQTFLIATVLSHCSLIQCSVIFYLA